MFETDKDGIPKDPNAYRSQQFWESRYAAQEHHEWLRMTRQDINEHLCPLIQPRHRVLVLGCGTSDFSKTIQVECQCLVTSVDYAESAIEHMQRVEPEMTWMVMDICDMRQIGDAVFDVVIDKATFDALFSDGSSPWDPSERVREDVRRAVQEAHRVLKPGGWLVSVSLGQPHFRLPFLRCADLNWQSVLSMPLGTFSHIYKLQKSKDG